MLSAPSVALTALHTQAACRVTAPPHTPVCQLDRVVGREHSEHSERDAGMVAVEISSGPGPRPGRLELRVQRPVFQQDDLNRTFGYGKQKKSGRPPRKCCDLRKLLWARVPALAWLSTYNWRRDLAGDLAAGATVSVMHVPQVGVSRDAQWAVTQ